MTAADVVADRLAAVAAALHISERAARAYIDQEAFDGPLGPLECSGTPSPRRAGDNDTSATGAVAKAGDTLARSGGAGTVRVGQLL